MEWRIGLKDFSREIYLRRGDMIKMGSRYFLLLNEKIKLSMFGPFYTCAKNEKISLVCVGKNWYTLNLDYIGPDDKIFLLE